MSPGAIDWRKYTNAERIDGTNVPCFYLGDVEQTLPDLLTHDWVLISETPLRERDDEDGRPNWCRRWYCRRCRLIEEWTSAE
jgi:hypothetical protein